MSKTNQKKVPHLWFDNEAKEAAEFLLFHIPRLKNYGCNNNP
jgi:predicted 3-demethylubiquinone-9 3-methyltransferase (glyoxalase superfamily)